MPDAEVKAFQVRLPIELYDKLSTSAEKNLRSLNAEIIMILRKYFLNPALFDLIPEIALDLITDPGEATAENRMILADQYFVLSDLMRKASKNPRKQKS